MNSQGVVKWIILSATSLIYLISAILMQIKIVVIQITKVIVRARHAPTHLYEKKLQKTACKTSSWLSNILGESNESKNEEMPSEKKKVEKTTKWSTSKFKTGKNAQHVTL